MHCYADQEEQEVNLVAKLLDKGITLFGLIISALIGASVTDIVSWTLGYRHWSLIVVFALSMLVSAYAFGYLAGVIRERFRHRK